MPAAPFSPISIKRLNDRARRASRKSEADRWVADHVIEGMRANGLTLRRTLGTTPSWWLSNGKSVTDTVAAIVTKSPSVVGVGDALFGREFSQTFRRSG